MVNHVTEVDNLCSTGAAEVSQESSVHFPQSCVLGVNCATPARALTSAALASVTDDAVHRTFSCRVTCGALSCDRAHCTSTSGDTRAA